MPTGRKINWYGDKNCPHEGPPETSVLEVRPVQEDSNKSSNTVSKSETHIAWLCSLKMRIGCIPQSPHKGW